MLNFIDACQRGLYDLVARPGEKKVKLRVLIAMYSKDGPKRFPSKMKARLNELFPSVMAMLRAVKRTDHRRAARLRKTTRLR